MLHATDMKCIKNSVSFKGEIAAAYPSKVIWLGKKEENLPAGTFAGKEYLLPKLLEC